MSRKKQVLPELADIIVDPKSNKKYQKGKFMGKVSTIELIFKYFKFKLFQQKIFNDIFKKSLLHVY